MTAPSAAVPTQICVMWLVLDFPRCIVAGSVMAFLDERAQAIAVELVTIPAVIRTIKLSIGCSVHDAR